jgi:hypothetical protein
MIFTLFNAHFLTIRYYVHIIQTTSLQSISIGCSLPSSSSNRCTVCIAPSGSESLPSSLFQSVAACLHQVPTDAQSALLLLALNPLSDNGHCSIGSSSSSLTMTSHPSAGSLRLQSRCFLTEPRQRDRKKLVESNRRWKARCFLSTGGGKC